mgnify:CR=1 FL=1
MVLHPALEELLRPFGFQRSFIQAHGSSTPANRVTESEILDRVAEAFDISSWPTDAARADDGRAPKARTAAPQMAPASTSVGRRGPYTTKITIPLSRVDLASPHNLIFSC